MQHFYFVISLATMMLVFIFYIFFLLFLFSFSVEHRCSSLGIFFIVFGRGKCAQGRNMSTILFLNERNMMTLELYNDTLARCFCHFWVITCDIGLYTIGAAISLQTLSTNIGNEVKMIKYSSVAIANALPVIDK